MKRASSLLILLVLCAPSSFAQSAKYLQSVEVGVENALGTDQPTVLKRKFTRLSRRQLTADLDLGESIEGQEITLVARPGLRLRFLVEQQIETSVTISDEGPHLDLRDWKHHYSPWQKLKSIGDHRFRINAVSEAESSRFPRVSGQEIRAAVRRFGDSRWVRLVRNIKGPRDAPASVGLSKIRLRISVTENGQWKPIQFLDFVIPMGC